MTTTILCVYCCEAKPKPSKGEHIILKGLGGRAKTRDVCSECNQRFGDEIDNQFLRHGPLAYYRNRDPTVREGQLGDIQFVPSPRGGYLDAIEGNALGTVVKIQVHIIGRDFLVFRPDNIATEVDLLLESLRGADLVIRDDIKDDEEHDPPRFIVDMKGKSHLIRARTPELFEKVKAAIKEGTRPPTREVEPVDITGTVYMARTNYDPNAIGRCVAKMAFNLATEMFRPETMLNYRFDDVREYIRGNNVVECVVTNSPDGNVVVKPDDRYVGRWLNEPRSEQVAPSNWHSIELHRIKGKLLARVYLVGGIWRFTVRLGPFPELQMELPVGISRQDDDDYWCVGSEQKSHAQVQTEIAKLEHKDRQALSEG